ncbi:MAG TPA: hypothetical protein VK935_20080, partial [Actinomycetospora sp.]|nr:hypothetical protein [Actinomycetospora sp.]
MGRHRDSGYGIRPPLPADATTVTSHRPPPGVARTRAISLVAAGALAGGAAIVATTAPWSEDTVSVRPASPPGGGLGAPDDRSGAPALSVPAPRAAEQARPVAAPVAEPLPAAIPEA